jgi:hypothetical protein
MFKRILVVLIVFVFITMVIASDKNTEKAAVIKVIEKAYLNGVFNVGNTDAMKTGFHKDFILKGIRDGELSELAITKWMEIVAKKKADGKFPPEVNYRFEYPMVDITGTTAIVKVAIFSGDKQIYTDYLLLLQFSDGWKITDKIYFRH